MRLTLAQLNPVVGDVEGNLSRALALIEKAAGEGCDLVVFPELYLTGYPPKDLLEFPRFIDRCGEALREIRSLSRRFPELGVLIGAPMPTGGDAGKGLSNCAVLIGGGKIVAQRAKCLLPTYDVFDEARYFDPGYDPQPVDFKGESLGLTVCEDAWNDPALWGRRPYSVDPVAELAAKGVSLIINISASPFTVGKEKIRFELARTHARRHRLPFLLLNQVGGNDELVFDGNSILVDSEGRLRHALPPFAEAVASVDTSSLPPPRLFRGQEKVESVFSALVLGTRDYVRKCGFEKVILGLSGGIDSAVTCVVAARALGAENVLALSLPSPFSSPGSRRDAARLATNLGLELKVVPIEQAMAAYEQILSPHFQGLEPDVTEENIQARIRGNIIMAFSNKLGYLPLSTGNKSELAVGYCTLYGDMSGGLAVISDVPKTTVYELARFINSEGEVIPGEIIAKAPSAELKEGQKDQDTLPPYEILDAILERYVDEKRSAGEIVAEGFAADTVHWVVEAVRKNEHKRRQAPPGLKVTGKAFGSGRRMPIAARYHL